MTMSFGPKFAVPLMLAGGRLFRCQLELVVMKERDNITMEEIQKYVGTVYDQSLEELGWLLDFDNGARSNY